MKSSEDDDESDKDYEESNISKEELNMSIDNLGCSPVKLIGHRDRGGYGKRKLAQIGNAAQAKMASALRLDADTLNGTVDASTQCCQSKQDLETLMKLIKSKFDISSASKKLKLLTLVPDSWSIEATQVYFSTSQRSIKRAREMKKYHGILVEPAKREGRNISNDVKEKVLELYLSDEFSRMCPGKKEFISVNIDGENISRKVVTS